MPDKQICIYIGKYNPTKQTNVWSKYKAYATYKEALKEFNALCKECVDYDYDDFIKEYGVPRIDIEIRINEKMLKWFGVYEQEDVEEKIEKEEEK